MWTASSLENTEPNHFVLLVPYRHSTGLTYTCAQSTPEIFECPADNVKDVEPDAAPEAFWSVLTIKFIALHDLKHIDDYI